MLYNFLSVIILSGVSPTPIQDAGDFEVKFSGGISNITSWIMRIIFTVAFLTALFQALRWYFGNPQTKQQVEEISRKYVGLIVLIVLLSSLINWLARMFT